MIMKWLAIVNPFSGGKKRESELRRVLSSLEKLTSKYMITKYQGHAEELAREASDFDGLAVVGGDGTLHEVLQGMNCYEQLLAVIPAGTGNSLARDLGLNSMMAGIQSVESRNLVRIDLMRVSFQDKNGLRREYVSASTIAIGYPTTVLKAANQRLKSLRKSCYPVAAAFKTLFQKHFHVQLRYNHSHLESKSLTGLLINNTRHVANFLAFPNASFEDGFMDVMELNAGCLKQTIHNLSVLSQRYFYMPAPVRGAASLLVEMAVPQDLVIDGEIYPEVTNLQIHMLPHKLRCYRRGKSHP